MKDEVEGTRHDVDDVARYMVEELQRLKFLDQEVAVHGIQQKFGDKFVYVNDNGNLAIDRQVLKAFRAMTPDVIWSRSDRAWRARAKGDGDGRQED